MEVRAAALDITLKLVSSKNVDDVVKLLKKELQKTTTSQEEKNSEYRQMLVSAIHSCAIRFHEVAASVVDLLLESIPELNTVAATEIITFIKQVVEKFPDLRSTIIARLLQSLKFFKSGKVFRGALWIIGEYSNDEKDIQSAWKAIRSNIGKVPILANETKSEEGDKDATEGTAKSSGAPSSGPKILADGTYATESALEQVPLTPKTPTSLSASKNPLRTLILEGDYHLAVVLSSTLVKLILRLSTLTTKTGLINALKAEAMLIMVSILRATSNKGRKSISDDPLERIAADIKILAEDNESEVKLAKDAFLEDTKQAFKEQLNKQASEARAKELEALHDTAEQVDDAIVFRQLTNKDQLVAEEAVKSELALVEEGAGSEIASNKEDLSSRLKKITQLTGFTDPVYAEAYVKANQYDVTLDVMLVNQTTETLRNLSVEFATLGDLKVVEKPTTQNIGPYGFHRVQCTIKVTSADTGVIFGNIVYDGHHANDSTIIILSDVHVDINDYVKPASCSEAQFRKMWNEFEWENKINVKT
ncbi:unnamed protein product [Ambrosiozyma monospora]|uniref:Unnamed protein product n=1 Tax=Ambrosiozyma monospora TaxID=43982 RepID=A0ACB5TA09_AMBMO|nr:unnamed protein product [Ambrosiozyma monospora]